ncbi:MAG: CpXC domain-containing protein [Elusimicrobiaceae bacterium]|nr:CpXC domain-containing protein [Elusimicrobiaceae bacterium]
MASLKGVITVSCPQDCGEFDAEVWTLIRADEDPDLKDMVRGGELNLVQCPVCGKLFYGSVPVVYLDPQADLSIFVFPQAGEHGEVERKLREEFALLRDGLLRELKMHAEPVVFFGAELLKEFLVSEQFLRDESDIIEYAARELGLETVMLAPARARECDWPYRVPAPGGRRTAAAVLPACDKVLAGYPALARLAKFRAALEKDPKLDRELA